MMKILVLTQNIPSPLSGADLRAYHIIKQLTQNFGYKVDLLSFNLEPPTRKHLKEIKSFCENSNFVNLYRPNSKMKRGLFAVKKTFSFKNLFSKSGDFEPLGNYISSKMDEKVTEWMGRHDYDLIIADSMTASYVSNSKVPKIVDPRDANTENRKKWFEKSRKVSEKAYWYFMYLKTKYLEKKIFKKFDYCLAVTDIDKRKFEKLGLQNVRVVTNGVDTSFYRPMDDKEEYPSLVYTGTMNTTKNVNSMLFFTSNIFPGIRKKFPNIKLYIVGKNPADNILDLDGGSIRVTGKVEDIREYLGISSVFICPMWEGTGIKNKVLEAMSSKNPVVTTPVGAYGIKARKGKDLIISHSPKEFSEAVLELLKNKELRDRIGSNARNAIIQNHTWKKVGKKVSKLVRKLVN
ncbi:hypothetical protein AKJ52_00045 [candidate division MSBL1 archaeon SCGC-AAA382C18]|uniref:Uncharacterized protein n=1 Tax=candidate division MSBL1 archaeon SCGC-AAA382C18 TaxID=1698281 RepID=A0A133VM52_9EURY|nr:hypothetical protein AKJ52_00045 [candidate division MSBL1 archaeon SCGC-AAA382C18]